MRIGNNEGNELRTKGQAVPGQIGLGAALDDDSWNIGEH